MDCFGAIMSQSSISGQECTRRSFLGRSAASVVAGLGSAVAAHESAGGATTFEPVRLGVIGVRRRGLELAQGLARLPGVEIATICDLDARARKSALKELANVQSRVPRVVADARRVLDDSSLAGVVIATPDHSHVPLALLACAAGKDIYLEVPTTHAAGESAALLAAAAESGRIVQCGLQQRSGAHFQSAVDLIRGGGIGRVGFVRTWAVHRRGALESPTASARGGTSAPGPEEYLAWLGAAPRRPFDPLRHHHHWRWYWDYGGGELGNLGVHLLDVARWGLGVDLPIRVTAQGARLAEAANFETPDTLNVQFEYPAATIVWEHRLWSDHGVEGRSAGVAFHGTAGTLVVDRGGWKIYGLKDGPSAPASPLLEPHLADFIDCVRTRRAPRADLATGCLSSEICHLGNRAYRTGGAITVPESSLSIV
jgi:predicted dehydrogenase